MKKLIVVVVVLLVLLLGLYEIVHWGFERVYVAEDEALMVIKKFGDPLPTVGSRRSAAGWAACAPRPAE